MKRFSSTNSLAALVSISEEKTQNAYQGYSKEFQAMLDSLEEEDHIEDRSRNIEKKRRLTLDQVKALEKNFEVEDKLDPEKKLKLAEELGLRPRQVAIWFQNRRARWKTKQLEREYGTMKANYEALKVDYNNLQKENEALNLKLKQLKAKLRKENEESSHSFKKDHPFSESENNVSVQSQNHDFNERNNSNGIITDHSNASSAHGLMNWIQFSDSRTIWGNGCQVHYQPHHVKVEELSLFSTEESCNFFSVDQAPTLHWYFPELQN